MRVAVVYQDEYELYGQHHPRYMVSALYQHKKESDEDFDRRVDSQIKEQCKVHQYSYVDAEYFDAE